MRALLDANLWISYLLTRDDKSSLRQVVQACLAGKIELIVPDQLIAELRAATSHRRLAKRIHQDELTLLLHQIGQVAQIPPPIDAELQQYSRDSKDDYLVAYGLMLEADYLVAGDRDLLVLQQVENLRIVTPAAFYRILMDQGFEIL